MGLHEKYYQLISSLAIILDRDGRKKLDHSLRTALIAAELAEKVLPEKTTLLLYTGLLHDVGGVGLPHHIVHYALDRKEDVPRVFKHPEKGAQVVERLPGLQAGTRYVREHHERWDGKGYPRQLSGDDLSLGGQILLLADELDLKMRSFQNNRTEIYNFFRQEKGKMFDSNLWSVLLDVIGTSSGGFFYQITNTSNLPGLLHQKRLDLNPLKFNNEASNPILQAVRVFSEVIDAKHPYTKGHSTRVAEYSAVIARHMRYKEKDVEDLKLAGYLHDLGKVAVPLEILDKKSGLSDKEYQKIKLHVLMTMELLDYIPFFRHLSPIAGGHHERWNGNGYPDGLSGKDIPLGARIMALADVLDALTSDRSYRQAISISEAADKLLKEKGTGFDPDVVVLLHNKEVINKLVSIKEKY